MTPRIHAVGICRFSMLGRGDWKLFRRLANDRLDAAYAAQADELFAAERMERRLDLFEELTLKGLGAQRDQDFHFLVISSDRMPSRYRDRLVAICAEVPQVTLRFYPPVHVTTAQKEMMEELGLPLADSIQFRLDDDDGISVDFILRARRIASSLWPHVHFGMSFAQHLYCVTDGDTAGVYEWFSPFLGTGAFVRNRTKSVFEFAHYAIPRRMLSVTEPGCPNIITHSGLNDTPRHSEAILRKRGMVRVAPVSLQRVFKRHFPYLSKRGLGLCGIADVGP